MVICGRSRARNLIGKVKQKLVIVFSQPQKFPRDFNAENRVLIKLNIGRKTQMIGWKFYHRNILLLKVILCYVYTSY